MLFYSFLICDWSILLWLVNNCRSAMFNFLFRSDKIPLKVKLVNAINIYDRKYCLLGYNLF